MNSENSFIVRGITVSFNRAIFIDAPLFPYLLMPSGVNAIKTAMKFSHLETTKLLKKVYEEVAGT